jgi:hypothetical protein
VASLTKNVHPADAEELPPWVGPFFVGLMVTGSVLLALGEAGVDFETAWAWRREYPVFAEYWDKSLRVHRRVMRGEDFHDVVRDEEGTLQ